MTHTLCVFFFFLCVCVGGGGGGAIICLSFSSTICMYRWRELKERLVEGEAKEWGGGGVGRWSLIGA